MNGTSINLRHLLAGLSDLKEHITDLYNSLKLNLGPEATFIREWCDLKRLQLDGDADDEIEGDTLISDILQHCWAKGVDYVWHYRGSKFRITPFKSGTTTDGGFIIYYGEKHSLVTFAGVVRDAVDTGTPIWEAIVAQMFGIADGYTSASLRNPEVLEQAVKEGRLAKVLDDMPAPDAEPDLKWKDGYDNATAVKVPEGADAVPDGTLACADPEPCPEEVPVPEPVIDQAEPQPVCGAPTSTICEYCTTQMYCTAPADVDCEYRNARCFVRPTDATAKPKKNIIRAGGPSEMTDTQKAEYERWKASVESPKRFG